MQKISLLLLFVILSSCASLPDVPACVELDINKGYCINTISDIEFAVTDKNNPLKEEWFELRPKMVMLPASSWAKIKAYILKQCERNNSCNLNLAKKKTSTIDRKIWPKN